MIFVGHTYFSVSKHCSPLWSANFKVSYILSLSFCLSSPPPFFIPSHYYITINLKLRSEVYGLETLFSISIFPPGEVITHIKEKQESF